MRLFALLLTISMLTACFQGPDPMVEYPNRENFIAYDESAIVVYDEPESDYYLAPEALNFTAPTEVFVPSSMEVYFEVGLSGSLADEVEWSVQIQNPLKGLRVLKNPTLNLWEVYGSLDSTEVEALFSDSYLLKLKLSPVGEMTAEQRDRIKYYNPPMYVKLKFNSEEN